MRSTRNPFAAIVWLIQQPNSHLGNRSNAEHPAEGMHSDPAQHFSKCSLRTETSLNSALGSEVTHQFVSESTDTALRDESGWDFSAYSSWHVSEVSLSVSRRSLYASSQGRSRWAVSRSST